MHGSSGNPPNWLRKFLSKVKYQLKAMLSIYSLWRTISRQNNSPPSSKCSPGPAAAESSQARIYLAKSHGNGKILQTETDFLKTFQSQWSIVIYDDKITFHHSCLPWIPKTKKPKDLATARRAPPRGRRLCSCRRLFSKTEPSAKSWPRTAESCLFGFYVYTVYTSEESCVSFYMK